MWRPLTIPERIDLLDQKLDRILAQNHEPTQFNRILHLLEKIMPAIDDLKAAIADLSAQIDTNNAEIETLLTKIATPGTSDADIQAATQQIRDIIAKNKAEVDKAVAAAP